MTPKDWSDLRLRLDAHNNLNKMAAHESGIGYETLARLIGRTDRFGLTNLTDDEIDILRLLNGPNAYAIYRMLLIKHNIKEKVNASK